MIEFMPGLFFGTREAEPARKLAEVSVNLWDFATKETIKRNMILYAGQINKCYDCYRKDTIVSCSESDGDEKSVACIIAYFIMYRRMPYEEVLELIRNVLPTSELNSFYIGILKSLEGRWSNPLLVVTRTWSKWDPNSRERVEYNWIPPGSCPNGYLKEGS